MTHTRHTIQVKLRKLPFCNRKILLINKTFQVALPKGTICGFARISFWSIRLLYTLEPFYITAILEDVTLRLFSHQPQPHFFLYFGSNPSIFRVLLYIEKKKLLKRLRLYISFGQGENIRATLIHGIGRHMIQIEATHFIDLYGGEMRTYALENQKFLISGSYGCFWVVLSLLVSE